MPDPSASARVVWALRRAFLQVEARKDELLQGSGVSPAQYAVLINLAGSPGLSGAELARRLQVSPQNVAVLVAALEQRGLVAREASPRYRHVKELRLTAEGAGLLETADRAVTALEGEVRAALGGDAALLHALLERLTTFREEAPARR